MDKTLRVLFVNATNPFSEIENRYRPLWPAYLAAYTKQNIGPAQIEFRFLTGRLEDEMAVFNPDIVAISCVSQNYAYACQYAALAKGVGKTVVIGGIHVSCLPETMTPDMDVGCIGEGEQTFTELLRHYNDHGNFKSKALNAIRGIAYWEDGRIVQTPLRPGLGRLDDLPHPKRSLIGYQRHDYMFTSRGCPYRCAFCASSRYWANVRYASPEYVVEEIEELIAHGVKTISFYDDLFIANKSRLRRIAELITTRHIHEKIRFTCSCRANHVTPEVVEYLKTMNVVSVGMGLESGNDRVLQYLKGQIAVSDNRRAVDLLKDAGLQANASFVIGAPDETEKEIMDTYDFINKSRLDFVDIYVLTPLPATPLWEYALRRNLVSSTMDWSRLNVNFEVNMNKAVIVSEKLSREQIRTIYRKFRYLRRCRIIKALPGSPWLSDLPRTAFRMLVEAVCRLFGRKG